MAPRPVVPAAAGATTTTVFRPTTALEARLAANLPDHASASATSRRTRQQQQQQHDDDEQPAPRPKFQTMTGKGRTRREELEAAAAEGGGRAAVEDDVGIDEEGDDDELEEELVDEDAVDESDEDGPRTKRASGKGRATAPVARATTATTREKNLNKRNSGSVGRRKITMSFIEEKARRTVTFTKRKSGLMKKAYELSTLTGTDCLVVVVSETGLVYTFATPSLKAVTETDRGKEVIADALKGDLTADGDSTTRTTTDKGKGKEQDHERERSGSATTIPLGGGAIDDLYLGMIDPSLATAGGGGSPYSATTSAYPFPSISLPPVASSSSAVSYPSPHSLPIPPPASTHPPPTLPLVIEDLDSHHPQHPPSQYHHLPHPAAFSFLNPTAAAAAGFSPGGGSARSPSAPSELASPSSFPPLDSCSMFHFDPPPPPAPSAGPPSFEPQPQHPHQPRDPPTVGVEGRPSLDPTRRRASGDDDARRAREDERYEDETPFARATRTHQAAFERYQNLVTSKLAWSDMTRDEMVAETLAENRRRGITHEAARKKFDEMVEESRNSTESERQAACEKLNEMVAEGRRLFPTAPGRYEEPVASGLGNKVSPPPPPPAPRRGTASKRARGTTAEAVDRRDGDGHGGTSDDVEADEERRDGGERRGSDGKRRKLGLGDFGHEAIEWQRRITDRAARNAAAASTSAAPDQSRAESPASSPAQRGQGREAESKDSTPARATNPGGDSRRGDGDERDDLEARRNFWRDRARESIANAKASRSITRFLHAHFLSLLGSGSTVVPPSIPVLCPETHQVVAEIEHLPPPTPSAVTYGLLKQFVRDERLDDDDAAETDPDRDDASSGRRRHDFVAVIDWFLLEQEAKGGAKLVGTMQQHLIEWFDFLEGHELISDGEYSALVAFGHGPGRAGGKRPGEKLRDQMRQGKGDLA
ncbi:hypothetical protein JCM11491_000036 [Sporobolomyces phaffii]